MSKTYLSNAFSLQMLSSMEADIAVRPTTLEEISSSDFISAVGHTDTAAVLQDMLGVSVPTQRINISLNAGDILYVAQLTGGRLPEGSTALPEGFAFRFLKVTLKGGKA